MHDFPSPSESRDHCPGRARRARLPRGWGAPFARQAKPDQSPVGRSSGECKISHHAQPPPLELSAGLWLPPGTGEGSTPTGPHQPRTPPQPGSATEHPRSLSRPAGGAPLTFAFNQVRTLRKEQTLRQTPPEARVEDDRREDERNPDEGRAPVRGTVRSAAQHRNIGRPTTNETTKHPPNTPPTTPSDTRPDLPTRPSSLPTAPRGRLR